jgi:penicillin G amidase
MHVRRCLVVLLALATHHALAQPSAPAPTHRLGVQSPAQLVRDRDGTVHIFAAKETDLAYLQGFVHARDRLFQMDSTRRQADGTLAELLGAAALSSDVQLRMIGLRRAAERSLPLQSREMRAALTAYAEGVNAYVQANPLPPEYAALRLTRFRPWSELDSLASLKLFAFPGFDELDRSLRLQAYQAAGANNGFDGTALYAGDTDRAAAFDPAATVPDAMGPPIRTPRRPGRAPAGMDSTHLDARAFGLAREFMQRLREAPFAEKLMKGTEGDRGSNAFVVSGRLSVSGEPLLAGDPHLPHGTPSTFHQLQLHAPQAGIDVIGATFPGLPFVLIGNNPSVSWTATNSLIDVTDVYREQVVPDPASPSGLSTLYQGQREHIVALPQTFRVNMAQQGATDNLVPATGVPPAVLIVPRRNQGALLQFDPASGVALSLQWAGFSGTRELDAFRGFNRARDLGDFTRALQDFDAGSQNFIYADVAGNIAYFLSGEVPLREDLQAGRVVGLPPTFIRNGQGGNEWLPAAIGTDPTRALPFEIVSDAEMPRVINPPRGFIVNANNDPTGATRDNDAFNQMRPGGGILYFGVSAFSEGVRAGRIEELLEERIRRRGRLTTDDLKDIQADTVMNDARVFTPSIVKAFANARRPGAHPALAQAAADPRVIEAVARLAAWDQSTPTGIRQGFDAGDVPGRLREPDPVEVRHSISATIYSVWRNQFLKNLLVAPLARFGLTLSSNRRDLLAAARNLIDGFDEHQGIGASGIDFFATAGIDDAVTRRDLLVLRSLAGALDLLGGDAYAAVFKRSPRQDDYRWGLLHRVVLDHPLGSPFSLPSQGGAFPSPLGADLPGFPVDGGLVTVDVSNNVLLRDEPAAFVVRFGAAQRYVARARVFGQGFDAQTSLAGGQSGVLGSPFYANLLEEWLSNGTHPLRQGRAEVLGHAATIETVLPRR